MTILWHGLGTFALNCGLHESMSPSMDELDALTHVIRGMLQCCNTGRLHLGYGYDDNDDGSMICESLFTI